MRLGPMRWLRHDKIFLFTLLHLFHEEVMLRQFSKSSDKMKGRAPKSVEINGLYRGDKDGYNWYVWAECHSARALR